MIGFRAGRALPTPTQARLSNITDCPLVGLTGIDVHPLGLTGPTFRERLLDLLDQHAREEIPPGCYVDVPDDGTWVDFGIVGVIPIRLADEEA